MDIFFAPQAMEDLRHWQKTRNEPVLARIRALLASIQATPYSGIGKPEALRYKLSGCWSRRITREHRLVYRVNDNRIEVLSLRLHY